MDWHIQNVLPIITALVVVAFDWGILYQKIKTFVTKEDVGKLIDDKLKGHCPNTPTLRRLDLDVAELKTWKEEHTTWGQRANEENHLVLQELRINMRRICEKLDIEYLNGNGNRNH